MWFSTGGAASRCRIRRGTRRVVRRGRFSRSAPYTRCTCLLSNRRQASRPWPGRCRLGFGRSGPPPHAARWREAPNVILAMRRTPSPSASRDAQATSRSEPPLQAPMQRPKTNSVPSIQSRCMMMASFRATATRALLYPARLAMSCPQPLSALGARLRYSRTPAASKSRLRVNRSPHLEILPV